MRIASVDFFYLSMPVIRDIGDGSQDALVVRVRSDDGQEGWGECEAAPLVSIAAWCCPMSHSACKPVGHTVLGARIDVPEDIRRLNREVRRNSLDLLQADHTLSGVDMALWDLLGRRLGEPVWRLLGWKRTFPKVAYASQLFGDTPAETRDKAVGVRTAGFRAAKFGWGPFGADLQADEAHVHAAREGLGPDIDLLVDAGTVWGEDVAEAQRRLPVLQECGVLWIEEPFVSGALQAYQELGRWHFWLFALGFNLTFAPLHIAGILGMPRRIYTYDAGRGWEIWNLVATIGVAFQALGILFFVANLLWSSRRGARAGDDPWDAWTLEWSTTSPPPPYNFETLPTVRSRRPLWDLKHPSDPDWRVE